MRVRVLGPVEVVGGGAPMSLGGPQQRRLLALLLVRPNEVVSIERMVSCLWSDGLAPDGASRSVMTYVSRLRAVLGNELVTTAVGGYRLDATRFAVDADEFQALVREAGAVDVGRAVELYDRALALWRGPAYGELGGEWWALAEATRLDELRVVAAEERAEALLTLGHHRRAIPDLAALVAEQPLRERPVSLLMQALYAAGRGVEALREYQAFRTRLGDETGLEPSSDLVALERSLAAGRPVARPHDRARLLRGYTLHDVIGEGAFGRVYAATQPGTNRSVAIKAIRPDLVDRPEFVRRFEAEAQLIARLEHPHIVPLYDYWREPGGAYLVFRLLAGGSALGALASGGRFDLERTSRLVEEIGGALLAAHAAGVVHHDVKPANILFDESGNAYLADFGIAVAGDPGGPPAVAEDVSAFGRTLWELLAGAAPFAASTSSAARLPSLVGHVDGHADALDAILRRATAPDPADRYVGVADLVVAWRAAVGRPGGVLTPVTPRTGATGSPRGRAVRRLAAEVASAANPYKGMRAFEEADAADFVGRDAEAGSLVTLLRTQPFVTVVGPSGSGKSSLVHAGVTPRLRAAGYRVATMVPGERPLAALREAVRAVTVDEPAGGDVVALLAAAADRRSGPLVLVVDQFEEAWTTATEAEREPFLEALARATAEGVACLVTIRADLFDRPLQHPLVGPRVAEVSVAVAPLGAAELERVVTEPAARVGVGFDEGIVSGLVADAVAQPAALPLLQFMLAELYERRVEGRIAASAVHELGGLGGAIGRRAEATYLGLDDGARAVARGLFGRLVAPGSGAVDTRRRARFGELSPDALAVVDRFVSARLLVVDRDPATREPVVDMAHEALIAGWARLRDWIEADRRWLGQLQHLAAATTAWDEAGRPEAELYRGARLEAVLEAPPERTDTLSGTEATFVAASRAARDAELAQERRTSRRLRRLLTVAAALLTLAVVATVVAGVQRSGAVDARRSAEVTALANRSLALRASQRDVAALLAVESSRLGGGAVARSALLGTFTKEPGFLGYLTFEGSRVVGAVIPGSTMALVTPVALGFDSANPRLRTVDLVTGALGRPFEPTGPFEYGTVYVAVSADGRRAGTISYQRVDGVTQAPKLVVFDVASGRVVGPARPVEVAPDDRQDVDLALNGDGSQVALSGGITGAVRIIDTITGDELATIDPPADMQPSAFGRDTSSAEWAPDGRLWVGSSGTSLRAFDPTTLALVRTIEVPRFATGGLLRFGADGTFVVGRGVNEGEGGGQQGAVARIDLVEGRTTWEIDPDDYGFGGCDSVAFSEPEGRLWCGDYFGVIRGRSLATGALDGTRIDHQRGWLQELDVVSSGGQRHLVSMGRSSPSIGRWRIDGEGPLATRLADAGFVADYSPDGRWVVVAAPADQPDGFAVALWDAATRRVVLDLPAATVDGTWLDDERLLALVDGGPAVVVDAVARTTTPVAVAPEPGWSDLVAVGPDRLAVGYGDGTVIVHDVTGGATVTRIQVTVGADGQPGRVSQLDVSADGRVLYVAGIGLRTFDAASGRALQVNDAEGIASVAVGGDVVAFGRTDGTLSLVDPDDIGTETVLPGARGFVSHLRFSADDSLLLAQANDATLALYDVPGRRQLGDHVDITGLDADLRPDGQELSLGRQDGGGIVTWTLEPEVLTAAACALAGRNLTRDEWQTYMGGLADHRPTCPQLPFERAS